MSSSKRPRRATANPLVEIARDLSRSLSELRFGPPVTHVYDPLDYAFAPHQAYLERFGGAPKQVVLLGMNPGPWGMAQTGIPFGEIAHVREWMGIDGEVGRPRAEHPKRPILGFACERSEVSGRRLWGLAKARCPDPEAFFREVLVMNYCPLVFMEESGRNRTPDKLPAEEREPLYARCDDALRRSIEHLRPRWLIGVGAFAEDRARRALSELEIQIGRVLHPSPASPVANRGWAEAALRELSALGVELPEDGASMR